MAQISRVSLQSLVSGLGFHNHLPFKNGKGFSVFVKRSRLELAKKKILQELASFKPTASGFTITVGGFTIQIRDADKASELLMGNKGKQAEGRFGHLLQEYLKLLGGAKVIFKGAGKTFVVPNVEMAESLEEKGVKSGGKGTNKKADVILHCKNGKEIPLSLKWTNGDSLASMDTFWRERAKKFVLYALKKGKTELVEMAGGIFKLENAAAIAVPASDDEVLYSAFGADIFPNGAIIGGRLQAADFAIDADKGTITITCDKIFRKPEDLKGQVWVQIRNDKSRRSPEGVFWSGLRIQSVLERNTRGAERFDFSERKAMGI